MERLKNIALVLFLALFIASLYFNVHHYTAKPEEICSDTVKKTIVDTIFYYKPVPKNITEIGKITVKLPIPKLPKNALKFPESTLKLQDSVGNFGKSVPKYDEEINFPIKIDNKGNSPDISSNFPDSVNVQIPITRKVYEDSTYKAYISGYNASLDSFYIYPQTKIITIKEKPKRWHLSISAGYGITPKGLQPCLMVGVSYMIFSF